MVLMLLACDPPTAAPAPAAPAPKAALATAPVGYESRATSAGFSIFIHQAVLAHPAEAHAVLDTVERSLTEAQVLLGETKVARLRGVRIWIEWEAHDLRERPRGKAEFHRSRSWLESHGFDGAKERSIEINDTRGFIEVARTNQPYALLHELAHAYELVVLAESDRSVDAAFEAARRSGAYDAVPRVGGPKGRAYALADAREYFAETTEAYFGVNDFYPFVREQLRDVDPIGYALMERIWGAPPPRVESPLLPCVAGAKSSFGGVSSALVFMNRSSRSVEIAWIDPSGARAQTTIIAANGELAQQTFDGHVFVASGANGSPCVGWVTASARPSAVVIR